jgi:hypothetical protein
MSGACACQIQIDRLTHSQPTSGAQMHSRWGSSQSVYLVPKCTAGGGVHSLSIWRPNAQPVGKPTVCLSGAQMHNRWGSSQSVYLAPTCTAGGGGHSLSIWRPNAQPVGEFGVARKIPSTVINNQGHGRWWHSGGAVTETSRRSMYAAKHACMMIDITMIPPAYGCRIR